MSRDINVDNVRILRPYFCTKRMHAVPRARCDIRRQTPYAPGVFQQHDNALDDFQVKARHGNCGVGT